MKCIYISFIKKVKFKKRLSVVEINEEMVTYSL